MKTLYIDMDNVLVDFKSGIDATDVNILSQFEGHLDDIPGIFSKMKPMTGAIDAFRKLAQKYDVYILSTAPWNNPSAWSDKVLWVTKYLDDIFHKRIILTHHKNFCKGDILIDDRAKHGSDIFEGEWIQFGSAQYPDWDSVLQYLLPKE